MSLELLLCGQLFLMHALVFMTFSGAVKLFLVMTAVEMREKTVTETLKPLCEHAGMARRIENDSKKEKVSMA